MDSPNESFTISSKQTLIEDQTSSSKPTVNKRSYRKTITVALLVLLTIIAISTILFYVCTKEKDPLNKYLSNSSKYYCHVTAYPDLCFESMSSVINASSLVSHDPTRIFSSSIRVCINEVQKTMSLFPSKTMISNASDLVELQNCEKWMNSSLNLLTKSFDVLGNDSDIESLTFDDMNSVRAYLRVASSYAMKCLSGNVGGVEEVKSGVERARKCMVNSVMLWRERELILDEFYNPHAVVSSDDYYYSYYPYDYYYGYYFNYGFLVCMYSVMYLFLALLYYLFWHSK